MTRMVMKQIRKLNVGKLLQRQLRHLVLLERADPYLFGRVGEEDGAEDAGREGEREEGGRVEVGEDLHAAGRVSSGRDILSLE
jgi:hypothetical protein